MLWIYKRLVYLRFGWVSSRLLYYKTFLTQRPIQNTIEDGAFCRNTQWFSAENYFLKKLHFRCSTGFWMHLCYRLFVWNHVKLFIWTETFTLWRTLRVSFLYYLCTIYTDILKSSTILLLLYKLLYKWVF